LNAGAEQEITSLSGHGAVSVLFKGDGDGAFKVRVYVDGATTAEDEFSTNEVRVGVYAFSTSLSIKLYNPSTSSVTGTSTSFGLRGVMR
jgi:hypothetical protein